jgi:hypothetical protein
MMTMIQTVVAVTATVDGAGVWKGVYLNATKRQALQYAQRAKEVAEYTEKGIAVELTAVRYTETDDTETLVAH